MIRANSLRIVLLLTLLVIGGGMALQAQRGRAPFPSSSNRNEEPDHNDPRKKLAKRMLKESFESMQKESQQLVEMSTELRDILGESSEDELSLDAMKKAEDIEKLAERIKNRMKNL
jgi:hypothetical protein